MCYTITRAVISSRYLAEIPNEHNVLCICAVHMLECDASAMAICSGRPNKKLQQKAKNKRKTIFNSIQNLTQTPKIQICSTEPYTCLTSKSLYLVSMFSFFVSLVSFFCLICFFVSRKAKPFLLFHFIFQLIYRLVFLAQITL